MKTFNNFISKFTLTTNVLNNTFFVFAVTFITVSLLLVIFNLDADKITFGGF